VTLPVYEELAGGDAWQHQVRHAVQTLEELERALELSASERDGVERALRDGFPMAITPYYLALCDRHDPRCPIRMQCVPQSAEARVGRGDLRDPLGEEAHEVAPHLVQRYPDRALLLATDRCGVYCRFCTRSRMVGAGGGARSATQLSAAYAYLREHPEIRDVIVSGGDPLVMSDARIAAVLSELRAIESVEYVRVASRTPVTLPQRITESLCRALRTHPAVWLMTHFNHPKELTAEARAACGMLADHGIPVMNQSVLLRGVNDDASTLERLFRGLVRTRVRPYYLLQADPVIGTSHLRTPLARGIELMAELQGRVSGPSEWDRAAQADRGHAERARKSADRAGLHREPAWVYDDAEDVSGGASRLHRPGARAVGSVEYVCEGRGTWR
jgi:lysine 2,3-aminomutase